MLLTLPQETVNEIIAHLRSDDRALRSLSVASKRLTEECRRYLFASICIDSWQKFTRWSDAIPPGEDGLSRYVRELDLDTTVIWTKVPWLPDLHTIYLRSFTQVEQLKIRPLDLHRVVLMDMVDNLESFFPTVRLLSIRPTGDYSTILKFLALFPHLETTCITSPSIHEDREIADPQNFVCRGNLVIKACRISPHANILSCLTRPTTCYRSISLGLVKVETFAPLERFFEICGGSLESIQFVSCILGPLVHCPPTLLSPSTELRNVKLSLRFFNDYLDVLTILLSITSTKIDSVTLFAWECPFPDDLENFSLRWFKIEDALCRLWELKKGSESGGGVMVDVYFDGAELADEVSRLSRRGEFMPRFQEGGILNIGMCDYNRAMAGIVPKEFR